MIVHSGALLVLVALTWEVILPLQDMLLRRGTKLDAVVLFLPFGVKILSAYFEGFRSIAYLLPGALLASHLYFQQPQDAVSTYLSLFASYASAPAVFAALAAAGVTDRKGHWIPPHAWRVVLFGGALTSIIGSALTHVIKHHRIPDHEVLISFAMYSIGNMLGLLVLMFGLMWMFRLARAPG